MTQLDLAPLYCNDPRQRLSYADLWALVMSERPEVYREFERFTLQAIAAGATRVGAKAVWERMRWERMVTTGGDEWKLNNNLTAYAAREFQRRHPHHAGVFETRGRRAA